MVMHWANSGGNHIGYQHMHAYWSCFSVVCLLQQQAELKDGILNYSN